MNLSTIKNYIATSTPSGVAKHFEMELKRAELKQAYKDKNIAFLEEHAKKNNHLAQKFLGLIYRYENDAKALRYFIQSADQGNKDAECYLKDMLLKGRGINDENRTDAEARLQQMARNTDDFRDWVLAKYSLGILLKSTKPKQAILLFNGLDEFVDIKVNGKFIDTESFSHIIDILCSSPEARTSLGESKCLHYLGRSARPDAMFHYAELCYHSEYSLFRDGFGSAKKTALEFYQEAAKKGHPEAQLRCLVVEAEINKDAKTLYQLGLDFFQGNDSKNMPQSEHLAGRCWSLAAKNGDARAAYQAANLAEHADYDQRYSMLQQLGKDDQFCEKNVSSASDYFYSIAAEGNYLPAVLERQADNGDANTAFALYELHSAGDSYLALPPNKDKAERYLRLAASSGHKAAVEIIKEPVSLNDDGEKKKNLPKLLQPDSDDTDKLEGYSQQLKARAFRDTQMTPQKYSYTNTNKLPKLLQNTDYNLGMSYIRGDEVKRNLLKGLSYLKRSADAGDDKALAELENTDLDSAFFNAVEEELSKR